MPRNRRRAQRSVDDTQLSLGVASLTVHDDGLPFLSYPSSRPVVPTSPPNAPMKPAVRDTVSGLGIATGANRYGSPVPIPRKGGGGSYTNGTLERTSSTQRSVPSLQTIPVSVSPSAAIPIVLNEFTLERNIDDVSPSSSSGSAPSFVFENGTLTVERPQPFFPDKFVGSYSQPPAKVAPLLGKRTASRPTPKELEIHFQKPPVANTTTPPANTVIKRAAPQPSRSINDSPIEALKAMIFGMPLTPAPNRHPTVLAIDCEMVGVGKVIGSRIRDGKRVPDYRSALARLSIVDFDGHILLDTFVNPGETVKDYRTAVSGVRAENLKGAMSLSDAKVLARKFFGNNIVVGHAVHNDFRVLRYHHDPSLVRDTQTCPEVVRKYGHSVGLRALCEREFSVNVQNGEHSSVRDARAAMAIYHLYHQQWERDLRKPRS